MTIEFTSVQFSKTIPEIPDALLEKLKTERVDGLNWDRLDEAFKVLRKPPDPEPTKSQKFWRKMFDVDNSPYTKEPREINWKSALDEYTSIFSDVSELPKHIRNIDTHLRGRDAGDMKERVQRVLAMAGMMGTFVAFDYVTSWPIKKLFEAYLPLRGDTSDHDAAIQAAAKFIEVSNDKLATAWGDDVATMLTGKKTSFTTEPTDKLADIGNLVLTKYEDMINGPVLEGLFRIIYQYPIFGALFEQAVARIDRLQSKNAAAKGVGKAIYMALGRYLYIRLGLDNKNINQLIAMPANYEAL